MIIYNVTLKVDWLIHDAWLAWMQQVHMPEVVAAGCFTGSQLIRLLETDEKEGPIYAAQYFAESKPDYDRYIELHSTLMRQKVTDKWGDQLIAFRSLMEIVQ